MLSNKRSLAYRRWLVRCLILAVYLLSLSMQPAAPVLAAPDTGFVVTATIDAVDAAPGDGICAISSALGGGCTLRAAVQEANAHPGPDTILLLSGNYHLVIDDRLLMTDPAGLTIQGGPGTIDASFVTGTPVFHIQAGAQAQINNMTLAARTGISYLNEGNLTLAGGVISGGNINIPNSSVIHNLGALTVTNVLIQGGRTTGILIDGNHATPARTKLSHVRLLNNQTTALVTGGGNNLVEIVDSIFALNSLAMRLNGGANQVTIRNSTISLNSAGGIVVGAGAVEFPVVVNILDSTFAENQNDSALRLTSGDAQRVQVLLNNVTIANNHGGNKVGGVFVPNASGLSPVAVLNSILAKNTSNDPARASTVGQGDGNPTAGDVPNTIPSDCSGRLLSGGHNLIGAVNGCTITGDIATNIVGVDPLLGPLTNNGGPTATYALLAGSPALNTGDPAQPGSGGNACEASDQLGTSRPQGTACDIGAYEAPSTVAAAPVLNSLAPTNVLAPAAALPLALSGANFNAASRVQWSGLSLTPSAFTPTTLQATIPASELTSGKLVTVTVVDTGSGLLSNALPFTVNNRLPTVITNKPTAVRLGATVQVVITGTNFVPTSVISADNTRLRTTFVNAQQVRATVPADLTTPTGKQIKLFVTNPAPGGGKSISFGTLTVGTVNVGIGSFESALKRPGDLSTLTLGWVHPVNWRLLENMALRLLDENDEVVLWLSFAEEFGTQGALVLHSAEGAIAAIGFPGDDTLLASDLGLLDLASSQIDAQPGTTVKVIYAFRFDQQAQGRTFQVELSADDQEGNAHGFEPAGTLTVPTAIFLPSITN